MTGEDGVGETDKASVYSRKGSIIMEELLTRVNDNLIEITTILCKINDNLIDMKEKGNKVEVEEPDTVQRYTYDTTLNGITFKKTPNGGWVKNEDDDYVRYSE